MKKILSMLVVLAALCMSASAAIMPSWVENLSPGQSYTYGDYQASKGFAEKSFTGTTFRSGLMFGDGVTGADISQTTSTSATGKQLGSVDRQLIGQSASAYAAYNDIMSYWDPENKNTALVAQMGITKNQFAAFSGALRATAPELETLVDIGGPTNNGAAIPDDHYTGKHAVTHVKALGVDPSWTATYSDEATVTAPTATLHQEVENAKVTISLDSAGTSFDPSIALYNPGCEGVNEIWQGYGQPGNSPYDLQNKLMDVGTTDDLIALAVTGYSPRSQLTETSSDMNSDVTLVQTIANEAAGPVVTTSLAGTSSLSGSFDNAFLDPGVKLSVDINTGSVPFNYWWTK